MNVNPQNRQKVLLIATASVIALYVLDAVLITPLTTTWKTHAAEIVKLQKDVARGRGLIERGPQTQRKWTEMQAGALPKDAAQAEQDLISAFDRWGQENRIELGSIKPQWKRGTDRFFDARMSRRCHRDARYAQPLSTSWKISDCPARRLSRADRT